MVPWSLNLARAQLKRTVHSLFPLALQYILPPSLVLTLVLVKLQSELI